MDYTPIALGTGSNSGRDPQAGAARFINCYVEDAGQEGKTRWPVYACSGFSAFATLASAGVGAIRAMLPLSASALYVVSGTRLVKVDAAGTETAISGALPSTGLVTMARNRREPNAQIGISVGGQFWVCEADALVQVDLSALVPAGVGLVAVESLDGYFLLLFDNGEFFASDIDASSIDDLNFARAESSPDGGVIIKARGREAVIFGEDSTEWWSNTGAADFPFERASSTDFGCYAAGSAVNVLHVGSESVVDTIAFAAADTNGAYAGVCLLDGYSARKISTAQVDRAIASETDRSTIRACTWSLNGHTFYAISTSTQTHVYDLATGAWHERTSAVLGFWRVRTAAAFGTKVLVGDYALGKLYWMREGLFDAANASQLTLRHSNNSAFTWNATRTAAIGSNAAAGTAVKINRLGQSREDGKLFQISVSNAVMEDGVGNAMTVQPPTVHAYPRRVRFYGARIDVVSGGSQTATPKALLSFALRQAVLNG